jgi:hypothetical protein
LTNPPQSKALQSVLKVSVTLIVQTSGKQSVPLL